MYALVGAYGCFVCFLFFFFQAEDGIRDYKVTGVQTCALPIYRILRYVTWAIGPVAVLLVISGWHALGNVRQVASGTVAALVGMVPQGLVLLTSVAFGVAAVTLARRRVLVQQLPAV